MITGKREVVKKLRIKNPCASAQDIAQKVGISRERVRQILSSEGLEIKSVLRGKPKIRVCMNCLKEFDNKLKQGKKFCSRKCWSDYSRITLVCQVCGKNFKRRASEVIYYFNHPQLGNGKIRESICCSRICNGKLRGSNYGFGLHPENIRAGLRERKYTRFDIDIVRELRELGYSWREISIKTGIPNGSIVYVYRMNSKNHLQE